MGEVSNVIGVLVTAVAIGGGVIVVAFVAYMVWIRKSQFRGS